MANNGLNGIRLTDIYGFKESDYQNFYNNNIEAANKAAKETGKSGDFIIKQKYINSLIRNKMGDNWYNANMTGKSFEDKVNAYNGLFDGNKPEGSYFTDTTNVTNEINSVVTNNQVANNENLEVPEDARLYNEGNLVPWKFQNKTYRDWFSQQARVNPEISRSDNESDTERQLNIFDAIYDNRYPSMAINNDGRDANSNSAIKRVAQYAPEIRKRIDENPRLANDMYIEFENNALLNLNDYLNFQGTPALNITPNEMKDIMARYYAEGMIRGDKAASDYLYAEIHDRIWNNQKIISFKNHGMLDKCQAAIIGAANYAIGEMVSVLGQVANIPTAIYRSNSDDYKNDDLSWWGNFTMALVDNPLSKWGNGLINTGAWWSDEQRRRAKTGYNSVALYRKTGNENKFWDVNTIFDIVQQTGFTVGAAKTATIMSKMSEATLLKLTNKLTTKIALEETSKLAANFYKVLDASARLGSTTFTTYNLGLAEGQLDQMATMGHYLDDQLSYLLNLKYIDENGREISPVDEYIRNEEGPGGGFERYYEEHRDKSIKFDPERPVEFDENEYRHRMQLEFNKLYNDYRVETAKRILETPEVRDKIYSTALRRSINVLNTEAMYIAFGDTFVSGILGAAFKGVKQTAKKAMFGREANDYLRMRVNNNGNWEAYAKDFDWWAKTKAVGSGAREMLWEGGEEGFQNVDTQVNIGVGDNFMAQYILSLGDEKAIQGLSDRISDNYALAGKLIGQNLFSSETIYSFLLGAISAGIGSPTIMRGSANYLNRRWSNEYNKDNLVAGWFKDMVSNPSQYWRNPFVENWNEQKQQQLNAAEEADAINSWLSNNGEIAAATDMTRLSSWIIRMAESSYNDKSDVDFRDAMMGQKIATIIMMDRIGDRVTGKGFKTWLKILSELKYGTNDAENIINKAIANQGLTNVSDEERKKILDRVTKRAKEAYDLFDRIHTLRDVIDVQFGDAISNDTKDAWVFKSLMHSDNEKRVNDILDNARKEYNKSGYKYQAATSATEEENAVARYGGVNTARAVLKALINEKKKLKQEKKNMPLFRYKSQKARLNAKIKEVKDALEVLTKLKETPLITNDKILGLDADAIALLLDDANASLYSKEQLKEIDKFRNNTRITNSILRDLNDAARLKKEREEFEADYNDMSKSIEDMVLYDRSIRTKAAEGIVRKRLDRALRATDYETFEEEMNKFMEEPHSIYEDMALNDVLGENQFYAKWIELKKKRRVDASIMQRSIKYKSLDNKRKTLFDLAYDKALRDGDTSSDHLIDIMSDDGFRNDAENKYGVSKNVKIDEDDIKEIAEQVSNYNRNTKIVEEIQKKLDEVAKEEEEETKREGKYIGYTQLLTDMNKVIYDGRKGLYHSLFDRMLEYIMGSKHKSVKGMTLKDFIDLANLYLPQSGQVTDTIFGENALGNTFSRGSISKKLAAMRKALEVYEQQSQFDAIKAVGSKALYDFYAALMQKCRSNSEIAEYMRRDIFELEKNTDYGTKFKRNEPKSDRFSRVVNASTKTSGEYTEMEKEWCEREHISENLEEAKKQYQKSGASGTAIFIREDELAGQIDGKDYKVNSDNKPVSMCISVRKGTKNSFEVNGVSYLKVGLLCASRSSTQEVLNDLNSIRDNSLTDDKGIVLDKNGRPYVKYNIRFYNDNKVSDINESVAKFIMDTYGIKTVDELIQKLTDGKELKIVYIDYEYNNRPFRGEYDVKRSFVGIDGVRHYLTPTKHKSNSNKKSIAIIDKNNKVNFIKVSTYDNVGFRIGEENSASEVNIVEYLTNVDIARDNNNNQIKTAISRLAAVLIPVGQRGGNNYISNLINAVENAIKIKDARKFNTDINDKIKQAVGNINNNNVNIGIESPFIVNLNLANNSLDIKVAESNDVISISLNDLYAACRYGINKFNKGNYRRVDNEKINTDYVKQLNETGLEEAYYKVMSAIQSAFASLALNADKTGLRKNESGYDMIKPQVTYSKLTDYNNTKEIENHLMEILSDDLIEILSVEVLEDKVEGGPPPQKPSSPTNNPNAKQEAINAIEKFRIDNINDDNTLHNSERGTTTFISKYSTEYSDSDNNITKEIAISLGNTIDKVYRTAIEIYSKDKNRSTNDIADDIFNQIFNATGWRAIPGVGNRDTLRKVVKSFINNVVKTIEGRGETILTNTYKLITTLNGREFSMIPDMITVDENGMYHIYDYKTIRFQSGASSKFDCRDKNDSSLIVEGFNNSNTVKKWQEQLSLYAHIVKAVTGRDVASIEIIPCVLRYIASEYERVDKKSDGTKIDFSSIGENVFDYKIIGSKTKFLMVGDTMFIPNTFANFNIMNLEDINKTAWLVGSSNDKIVEFNDDASPKLPDDGNPPANPPQAEPQSSSDEKLLDDAHCGTGGKKSDGSDDGIHNGFYDFGF